MFRKRKKIKPYRIDTTHKGFEYIGIKLTDEQFQDLAALNMLWIGNEERKKSPVPHTNSYEDIRLTATRNDM